MALYAVADSMLPSPDARAVRVTARGSEAAMSRICRRIGLCLVLALLATTALAAPRAQRVVAAPPLPSGCEPAELRVRLAGADSADVAKACGGIVRPWADRGMRGRGLSLRVYGRRHADQDWAERAARLLTGDSVVDTAYDQPWIEIGCDTAAHVPIYVLRLMRNGQSTVAVLRFDLGAALLFDRERPLGSIAFGERGDSLWAALAEVLEDDPLLRGPRPTPLPALMEFHPPDLGVAKAEELPEQTKKVAPVYPREAREDGVSGEVFLQALVSRDGTIRDAFVLSGPPMLRDAALDCIWEWRFKPAANAHQPVAVWVMLPVKFTLR
jgi:TonB family protein